MGFTKLVIYVSEKSATWQSSVATQWSNINDTSRHRCVMTSGIQNRKIYVHAL